MLFLARGLLIFRSCCEVSVAGTTRGYEYINDSNSIGPGNERVLGVGGWVYEGGRFGGQHFHKVGYDQWIIVVNGLVL